MLNDRIDFDELKMIQLTGHSLENRPPERKKKPWRIKLLIALICAAVLGALVYFGVEKGAFLVGETDDAVKYESTKQVNLCMGKVRTLNPVSAKDESAYRIMQLVYQGLFSLDETCEPVPVLAKSYEIDENGYLMTVSLDSSVKWADGEAFTAADVVFSINAYKNAGMNSMYHSYVQSINSAKASGSDTVLIRFSSAVNCVPENLVFPIVPSHAYKSVKAALVADADFLPFGTGAYMAESVDMFNEIVLTANPNYKGSVVENTLHFKVVPDPDFDVSMFKMGSVDYMVMKELDRKVQLANVNAVTSDFVSNEAEAISFNLRSEVTSERKVRCAIAYAIDRQTILDDCYYSNGVLNDTIYLPGYLGVDSNTDHYAFSTKKSLNLLKIAGYADADNDGRLEQGGADYLLRVAAVAENGEEMKESPQELDEITVRILVNAGNPHRVVAAQNIGSSLKKLGMNVEMNALEEEACRAALAQGDFDIYLGGFQFRDCWSVRNYLHTGGAGVTGYSSVRVDALLDRMLKEQGSQKVATFSELQDLLIEDLPYYCLLYKTYGVAAAVGVKGEGTPTFFNPYAGVENFSVERAVYTEPETTDTVDSLE